MVGPMPSEVTEVELMLKRKNRLAEERKAAEFRAAERDKRAEAQRMLSLAAAARSRQLARMRETDAARLRAEADRCAGEAKRADDRAKVFARDEEVIAVKFAHAERSTALSAANDSDWTIV
jgi:hypothetical protein